MSANVSLRRFEVELNISADELLKLYRGQAHVVSVRAKNGRHIRFPASSLKPFVSREGVVGHFILHVDSNNKLLSLQRR